MNKNGPIIIIEDDIEDQELLKDAFSELSYTNKLHFFEDGEAALEYLNGEGIDAVPFLILSDINMPKLNGFALRDKIKTDAELQVRCIPYLFFSTSVNRQAVIDAYSLSVQGFFIKEDSFKKLKNTIRVIMEYWTECAAPNNFHATD